MRNPKRLDSFYKEFKRIHKEYFPDWRFGQLISNFFGWVIEKKRMDIFFPEEDQMIKFFDEFAHEVTGQNTETEVMNNDKD